MNGEVVNYQDRNGIGISTIEILLIGQNCQNHQTGNDMFYQIGLWQIDVVLIVVLATIMMMYFDYMDRP